MCLMGKKCLSIAGVHQRLGLAVVASIERQERKGVLAGFFVSRWGFLPPCALLRCERLPRFDHRLVLGRLLFSPGGIPLDWLLRLDCFRFTGARFLRCTQFGLHDGQFFLDLFCARCSPNSLKSPPYKPVMHGCKRNIAQKRGAPRTNWFRNHPSSLENLASVRHRFFQLIRCRYLRFRPLLTEVGRLGFAVPGTWHSAR